MMKAQLEQRLQQLRQEFESGQRMLADYEAKQAELRQTLLRISGAIQVLEEELAQANGRPAEAEGLEVDRVATAADEKIA